MNAIIFADALLSKKKIKKILLEEKSKSLKKIIVCDGAARFFKTIKDIPFVVIGDLDSLSKRDQLVFIKKKNVKLIKNSNPSTTDLEKALEYCLRYKIDEIKIFGALGKRFDHSIYNIALLKKYYKKSRRITLYNETEKVFITQNKEIKLLNNKNKRISFFPWNQATVSTVGLKYNLKNKKMVLGEFESVSNEVIKNEAYITLHKGVLLVVSSLLRTRDV